MNKSTFLLEDVLSVLDDYKIIGDRKKTFDLFSPIDGSTDRSLTFCTETNGIVKEKISNTEANIIICSLDAMKFIDNKNKTIIYVKKPRLAIIKMLNYIYPNKKESYICNTVKIGNNTIIDHTSTVCSYTIIGNNVVIGNNCIIGSNCNILDDTEIGDNVRIKSGCTIGSDGFGYEKGNNNEWIKFPHIGKVIIKNNVDIGANTCIDRGSLDNTIIEDGVKIDNLVHIAHGAKIGKNTLIITLSCIAGSVKIGNNCWIAPGAIIRNGLVLGNNVTVGMGSVVTKNIDDDDIVIGIPAKSIKNKC